ncbi:MAG: type 2 isopentenyl-diphosphate Delta-isomerase [Candidatus Bathyarchaeota archaeon]|nr:type 2 isopentenyl-diphosphate Delta-isomerase [Candidatus Bathyarchaeota archaeon]
MAKHEEVSRRKVNHLRICLTRDVKPKKLTTGFEDVYLVHEALPELNIEEIDTSTVFFGYKFSFPVFISAMTGGVRVALRVNANLAEAAEKLGLGMGVGSQRAALENPKLKESFKIVREKAPSIFVAANIGAAQLVKGYGVNEVLKIVEMVNANALAIHLNLLHEALQVEGEAVFNGVFRKICELKKSLNIPIIVKETGSGISAETAKKLEEAGVACIDIGGGGGISWAAVEYYRARGVEKKIKQALCLTFLDWGIPTAVSLIETVKSTKLPIIATGGIRSGVDVAKSLALGAQLAGVASPLLKPATKNVNAVVWHLKVMLEELRTSMLLVGKKSVEELKKAPLVIVGRTFEWLKNRGFNVEEYARRGFKV